MNPPRQPAGHPTGRPPWGYRAGGTRPAGPVWECAPAAAAGVGAARPQLSGEFIEEDPHRLRSAGCDVGDADTIDAGSASIGGHVVPCPDYCVAAGDPVEHVMEMTFRILLGTAVEHALQSTKGVQPFGLPDRALLTSRHSSASLSATTCIGEVGALRSPGVVLSHGLDRYYDPLRLPLENPPLPGATGYGQVTLSTPRRAEAEEGLSSSRDTLLAIPRPLRRRVLRHPLQVLRCLAWPSPNPHRLGTLRFPLSLEP